VRSYKRKHKWKLLSSPASNLESVARSDKKYDAFYKNVYFPIQKKHLLLESRSPATLERDLDGRRQSIQVTLKLVTILHYVASALVPDGQYYPPSIARSGPLFSKLSHMGYSISGGIGSTSVETQWGRAARLQPGNGVTPFVSDAISIWVEGAERRP
jgi:hypothetical protein